MKGIIIGAVSSYTHGKEFDAAEKAGVIEVHRIPADILNFRKLFKKRIDIFPINPDTGYYLLQREFKKEEDQLVTHHTKPVQNWSYHLLLSKKISRNKRMLTLFNRGLSRLKKSGKHGHYIMESRKGTYNKITLQGQE